MTAAAADAPRGRNLRILRRLLPYLRPYGAAVAGATLGLLISAAALLGIGQGVRVLVDQGFTAGDSAVLDRAALVLLAVILIMAVAAFARIYLVSWLGERVVADLRRELYSHLLGLHPGFFETARTGELLSRLTTDTTLLQTLIGVSVSAALRHILTLAGGLGLLLVTSPRLTGLVVLVVPLVVGPIIVIGRRVRRLSRDSQDRVADLGAQVEESLFGIRTVQAFGHESALRQRFAAAVESAFQTAAQRSRVRAVMSLVVMALVFGAVVVILWIGGHDVLNGRLTGGALSAFVVYAVLVAGAVAALSEIAGDVQRAAGATERLFELFDSVPQITAPPRPVALPPPRGTVTFDQVRFVYPSRPDEAALDSLSFAVQPGETVALVGPSGAGKSTVFQLLLRFYDPAGGRVLIDDVDLRLCDPAEARRRIALVPQDPVIFSTTAMENIRYGRPDASDAEVRAAASAANALDFLDALPQGLNSYLGEKGVRLSGGQRQRIAIARAILRDAPLLLLDEATSALDAESERAVQQALATLIGGRTTLVIAHRLATVTRADRILVLDQGRLVAQGRHADLIAQGGLYARLAALQFDTAPAADSMLSSAAV